MDPPEPSFGPLAVLFFAFCTHSKAQQRNEKTRHDAQQGKAEQQSRSAPRHTPKRRACQAKRLARTSSSASVRTNTATANSGRTLSTASAATFQRIVRRCRLHLLGLPGRAFRPRANPGLTRRGPQLTVFRALWISVGQVLGPTGLVVEVPSQCLGIRSFLTP